MIFEEETWIDSDTGKTLESSLFGIPYGLPKNAQDSKVASHFPKRKTNNKSCVELSKHSNCNAKLRSKKPVGSMQQECLKSNVDARFPVECIATEKCDEDISIPVSNKNLLTNTGNTYTSSQEEKRKFKVNHTDSGLTFGIKERGMKSNWRKRALSKLMIKEITKSGEQDLIAKSGKSTDRCDFDQDVPLRNEKSVETMDNSYSNEPHKYKRSAEYSNLIRGGKKRKTESSSINKDNLPESRSEALHRAVTSKLKAAQFRFINEQLYTRSSGEAKKLFAKEKNLFKIYHDGYTQQVSKWPSNPLDAIIHFIQKRPSSWVIGDFGCGDARLASQVKNRVHSYDLIATNDRVTVADIAHVPLPNDSLDVVVLCLSLMGTNYVDFIREANRTLKVKGFLLIAEIQSRFKSLLKFKNLMKNLGFQLKNEETNSYFVSFNYMKSRPPNREFKTASGLLKPCVYKKR